MKASLALTGLALLVLVTGTPAETASKNWNWTSRRFAPCEGIGLAGSFTSHAEAEISGAGGSRKLTHLSVFADSAAFSNGNASIAVLVSVIKDGRTVASMKLTDAPLNSVSRDPKDYESKSKFLPDGKALAIPEGTMVNLEVTATVTKDGDTCVLGTSKHEFDPSE